MRKFFIFLLTCMATNHAIGANYNCTPIETGWINRDFVYHLWGSSKWTQTNNKFISLYCGHKEGGAKGCPNGTFLVTGNQRVLQCNTSGDNKWKDIDDNKIQDCDFESKHKHYTQITNWKLNTVLFADTNEIRIIQTDPQEGYKNNVFTTSNLNSVCKIAKAELDKLNQPAQDEQTGTTSVTTDTNLEQAQSSQTHVVPEVPQPTAGDKCPADQLPQFATAGVYINSGGKLTCAATECKSGTYLVLKSGKSDGWCIASSYCNRQQNTHLNIIDGTKTDLQCIPNESPSTGTGNENPQGQESSGDPAPSEQNPAPDKQEGTTAQNDDNQSSDDTPQVNTPTKPVELTDGDKCTPTDANATAGIVRDGMCVPALCRDGFEVSDNRCVEIGGDCDTLPKNATAAHRKYDATKKEIVCIVDSCAKTYKVSDDKLSCVPDPQAQLDQARNAEQSLTARLTSGAAIGAMGIGGMQALSAVAEQNADAAAEQDMSAYLATFRCDFGQGRNIKGGEKQIELPGETVYSN